MKTIRLFASLRDLAGSREVAVPLEGRQTVQGVLLALSEAYPSLGAEVLNAEGRLAGRVQVLVNGRHIDWLQGLDTPVDEEDDLALIPPLAGG